jgi:tetratricopeptide (TPR) repeat protein
MIGKLLSLIIALAIGGSALTRLSPTVDEIKSRFELAQKYYAAKDYDNGVKIFNEIVETPNRAILDVDTITVAIDDLILPIRVAATYQVGNSYRNVGLDLLERSRLSREEGDSTLADQRREEAFQALRPAKMHFSRIVESDRAPYNVRVMSQYQIIRADYAMEDYPSVVEDVGRLLTRFPGSEYEGASLYDLGWAYFGMGEYPHAIETFERVLRISTDAIRTDRAMFQIAESYSALADYANALVWYTRLVDKYDFSKLSERELKLMQTAKLRGVVQETTRELVAKAQIKIGDTYSQQGDVDQAIAAYSLVPQRYPQEQFLVEQSYTRLATLILERRGLDEGIRAYQQAIQSVNRKEFQATAQLQIARLLFEVGRFEEAIDAYRVYTKAYPDVTRIVGFTFDKAIFKIAEAYREIGRRALAAEDTERARGAFVEAMTHYRSVLTDYGESPLVPDATFGLGISFHAIEESDSATAMFQDVVQHYPSHPAAPGALLQIARLRYGAKNYGGAAGTYERFIATYPHSELLDDAYIELGVVYKAMNRLDDALLTFQKVSRSSPNWVKVRVEIGEMLTAAGRYEEAQEGLDEAIAQAAGDSEDTAELYYIKGKIAYSEKKYGEAIAALSIAIADSFNAQIVTSGRFMRGLSYYEVGKGTDAAGDSAGGTKAYDLCAQDLQNALSSDLPPKMRNIAYRTLGIAMTRLGRSTETIRYYSELIAQTSDPQERAGFQLLLMELYYDQRQFEEAIALARRLIQERFEDNNEMGYFLKERAYSVLSSAALELKRYEDAVNAAKEGLSAYPHSGESASMAFTVGIGQYNLERYAEAATSFESYIRQFPRDRGALHGYYYAGQSYQILGEYAKAATWFRNLVDRFSDSGYEPEALFLCGENFYNAFRFQESLETYEELLRRFPGSDFADDAMYSSAWALFELKRMEDGVRRMEQLVTTFPRSVHAPRTQFSIGDYYYSIKEYRKAQEAYKKLVNLYPQSTETGRARELIVELDEEIASQIYDEAVAAHQKKEYQTAIRLYQSIAEGYPKTYTALAALCNMGVVLEDAGDKRRAEQAYREAISRGGTDESGQEVVAFAKARLERL